MARVDGSDLAGAGGRPRRPRQPSPARRARARWAAIVAALLLWQLTATFGLVRESILPTPLDVLRAGGELATTGQLGQDTLLSAEELTLGLTPAIVVGVALGSLLGRSRRLAHLFDPTLMTVNATPRIALLPLLVIWFGIGPVSKAWIAFLGAVLPVLINTQAGIGSLDPVWIRTVRSLGAGRWQLARTVLLPGALPAILTGVRLGIGRAILGVVAGEMYVSTGGIGHLLQDYGNAGRTPYILALGLAITLVGAACVGAVAMLEARCATWRTQDT